jgi:hypothetical protein
MKMWTVCMRSGWSVTFQAEQCGRGEVWLPFYDRDTELMESEAETIAEMHQWEDEHLVVSFAVKDIAAIIAQPGRPVMRAVWRP